jgi:hypothetical protein
MISLTVAAFLNSSPSALVEKLAMQAVQSHRTNERQQLRA